MTRRKEKRIDGGFLLVPKNILRSQNYLKLTPKAVKLLLDLGEQYNGKNNGDLCAAWSMMKERGWNSKDTLNKALRELEHYSFIHMIQKGGLNRPCLYALCWRDINKRSLDPDFPTLERARQYLETKKKYHYQKK